MRNTRFSKTPRKQRRKIAKALGVYLQKIEDENNKRKAGLIK